MQKTAHQESTPQESFWILVAFPDGSLVAFPNGLSCVQWHFPTDVHFCEFWCAISCPKACFSASSSSAGIILGGGNGRHNIQVMNLPTTADKALG